jgi:hypothetical protein
MVGVHYHEPSKDETSTPDVGIAFNFISNEDTEGDGRGDDGDEDAEDKPAKVFSSLGGPSLLVIAGICLLQSFVWYKSRNKNLSKALGVLS